METIIMTVPHYIQCEYDDTWSTLHLLTLCLEKKCNAFCDNNMIINHALGNAHVEKEGIMIINPPLSLLST